jgi:hypothetical protein
MKKKFMYLILLLLIASCSSGGNDDTAIPTNPNNNNGNNNNNNPTPEWLIPINEVRDGGPGKDGIPSIDSPNFVSLNDPLASYVKDLDLVIGVVKGNTARAYPHKIMDWHEIVNDEINGECLAINYCPLTGTAFGWEGVAGGSKSEFGVSGLLYNANLILYDRNTNSNWSQLKLQCVNGSLISTEPELVNIVETTWANWKILYPDTEVLSLDTGFSRDYSLYPYGSYRTDHGYFIFPVTPLNPALPYKERVYAIIDDDLAKIYQFSKFINGRVVQETFNGKDYLIIGNEHLIEAFELTGDYKNLTFDYGLVFIEEDGGFFKDNEGNVWSAFGEALSGPRTGERLTPSKSVVSYWFAIGAFYPDPEIY